MAEPSILHWLTSDLPSFEVIRQVSLLRQHKTGSPSSIPKDLDEPRPHGSTCTERNSRRSSHQWLQHSEICTNINTALFTNQVHKYSTAAKTFKLVWNYNPHSGTRQNYTIKYTATQLPRLNTPKSFTKGATPSPPVFHFFKKQPLGT